MKFKELVMSVRYEEVEPAVVGFLNMLSAQDTEK